MRRRPEPTTVAELRAALNDIIGEYLGAFSDGTPGLWVEPPAKNEAAKGVICVIDRDKQPGESRPAGPQTSNMYFWKIRITNYESSEGDRAGKDANEILRLEDLYHENMDKALTEIRRHFPANRELASPNTRGTYRSVVFMLKRHELLNPCG